jgi:hypothetical protein
MQSDELTKEYSRLNLFFIPHSALCLIFYPVHHVNSLLHLRLYRPLLDNLPDASNVFFSGAYVSYREAQRQLAV